VRLIAIDRPGIGESTFTADRTIDGTVADFEAAEALMAQWPTGWRFAGFASGGRDSCHRGTNRWTGKTMRAWILAVSALLLSVAFIAVLRVPGLSASLVSVVSNGGQLAAALCASAGCAVAARRSGGGHRGEAWWWLAVGTGCWAAGQAVWSFYEVVLGRAVPFPSLADAGFLAFPLAAGVGLLIWAGNVSHQVVARGRDLRDGAIIAASLLVLSWVMVMAPLVKAGGESTFSLVLSLAYPGGDVVLATLVLITLVRVQTDRTTLTLLALGLGGFAVADSLFSYMTSNQTYTSADLISNSGWVFGFLFVATSAMTTRTSAQTSARSSNRRPRPAQSRGSAESAREHRPAARSSRRWLALPYLPLLAAGVALFADLRAATSDPLVDLLLASALVAMVLGRQFLAMIDNQRLLTALEKAGSQLEHQATHDALTGLPNRVLFLKRLDHALMRPSSDVSVLFCDLDDFKPVNDRLGHAAGDLLLALVAARLLDCVRDTDTVARLGGDEFAIVMENCTDAHAIADRIVASMNQDTQVLGRTVNTSISVGVAHHQGTPAPPPAVAPRRPGSLRSIEPSGARSRSYSTTADDVATLTAAARREATAALLLRLADTAMYAAKTAGKAQAVLTGDPIPTSLPTRSLHRSS
jgi:diguanylate cyclase (GGDEF)-like protein